MPVAATNPINLDTSIPELRVGDYLTAIVHWACPDGGSPATLSGVPLLASAGIPIAVGTAGIDFYGALATVEGSRLSQGWLEDPGVLCNYFIYWDAAYGSYPYNTWEVHRTAPAIGGSTAPSITIPEEGGGFVRHYFFNGPEPDFETITFTNEDAEEEEIDGNWSVGGFDTTESGMGRTSELNLVGVTDSHEVTASSWATVSLSYGFYPDGPGDHWGTPGSPSCPLQWDGP